MSARSTKIVRTSYGSGGGSSSYGGDFGVYGGLGGSKGGSKGGYSSKSAISYRSVPIASSSSTILRSSMRGVGGGAYAIGAGSGAGYGMGGAGYGMGGASYGAGGSMLGSGLGFGYGGGSMVVPPITNVQVNHSLLTPVDITIDPSIQLVRTQEKDQIKGLNNRFANFIEKVCDPLIFELQLETNIT